MSDAPHSETEARSLQRLSDALDSGRLQPVRRLIKSLSEAEIGHLLESLPINQRRLVWGLVEADRQGEVLVHVNDEVRGGLIESMEDVDLVAAAEGLDLDDLADILDDLPEPVSQEIMASMDATNRERLVQVLSYHEETAGGLMNPDVVTVRADVSLDVVLRYMRKLGELPHLTDHLLVVDRNDRYQGRLNLSDLVTKPSDLRVADVMDTNVPAIAVDLDDGDVATFFEHQDLVSAAVVDADNHLLGRITIDDVVDVIREESEHSVLSMAGLDEEDDMFAPVLQNSRRRAIWLGVNLLTALLAAWVIGLFEGTLERVVALAILMPVVASMGGIAGSQTLTLMIRGMAVGQVGKANLKPLFQRETAVGLINGTLFALIIAAVAVLWFEDTELGLVIAAAIVINLLAAAIAGVLIPLALERLRIDPALAGGVVLTTVTDVVGFLSFLGLGTLLLI